MKNIHSSADNISTSNMPISDIPDELWNLILSHDRIPSRYALINRQVEAITRDLRNEYSAMNRYYPEWYRDADVAMYQLNRVALVTRKNHLHWDLFMRIISFWRDNTDIVLFALKTSYIFQQYDITDKIIDMIPSILEYRNDDRVRIPPIIRRYLHLRGRGNEAPINSIDIAADMVGYLSLEMIHQLQSDVSFMKSLQEEYEEYEDGGNEALHILWLYQTIHQIPDTLPVMHPHWNHGMLLLRYGGNLGKHADQYVWESLSDRLAYWNIPVTESMIIDAEGYLKHNSCGNPTFTDQSSPILVRVFYSEIEEISNTENRAIQIAIESSRVPVQWQSLQDQYER